jgi:hypothetical protein
MPGAEARVASLPTPQKESPAGDDPVEPLPQGEASGNVQQRRQGPKPGDTTAQHPRHLGAPINLSLRVDQVDFPHQVLAIQPWPSPRYLGILQREERQPVTSIPSGQLLHRRRAQGALAIVDDHVGPGTLVRRRHLIRHDANPGKTPAHGRFASMPCKWRACLRSVTRAELYSSRSVVRAEPCP